MGLLGRAVPPRPSIRPVARRRPTYSEDGIRLLAQGWEASGYLCAQRLTAALPTWLPWLKRRATVTPTLEAQLERSPRQIDRRLRARKHRLTRRRDGTTRPGSLWKHQIPITTDHGEVTTPGDLEIDWVSHSGASASGEFLHTLDCVDIHTTWVERQAVTLIEGRLPGARRGLDSDKGSECITAHLMAGGQRPGGHAIQFTRSRPYKKDDQAQIEQKNWPHVRKLVGWERDDTPEARAARTLLYADLRLFPNLFQPSMTLQGNERRGARLIRRDATPRTPFERVRACPDADSPKVAALARLLATTDPFVRSPRIDQHLEPAVGARHADLPYAARGGPSVTAAASEHPVARVDLQPESPASLISLGGAYGQKTGAHRWLRSDDPQAGQGERPGKNGSPRRRSLR